MQFVSIYDLLLDKARSQNITLDEFYLFFRKRKIRKTDVMNLSQTSYIPSDENFRTVIENFLEMSELEIDLSMGRIPSEYREAYFENIKSIAALLEPKKTDKNDKYGKRYEHIGQWQHLQLALVIAVDTIRLDFEAKIQVYYAIRQEAFNAEENLLGANAPKITNHIMVLNYSKEEQERIFNNTIKIQHADYLFNPRLIENSNYAEAFIGIDRLCHPYVTGKDESIFECIYRHSFDRAREIQYIGDALAVNLAKIRKIESQAKREEQVKEIIESTSVSSATSTSGNRTYYSDKQILLRNYWANPDNFKNFIQLIEIYYLWKI